MRIDEDRLLREISDLVRLRKAELAERELERDAIALALRAGDPKTYTLDQLAALTGLSHNAFWLKQRAWRSLPQAVADEGRLLEVCETISELKRTIAAGSAERDDLALGLRAQDPKRYSQSKLGEMTGMSQMAISKKERGV